MSDFYCDEVLSGKTPVERVFETENALAFHHTRPSYPSHVVVIPKRHVDSLTALAPDDGALLLEMMDLIKKAAARAVEQFGACRVITNLGAYQDSRHLHWHVISGAKQSPVPLAIARALPKIAAALNARGVRWALGASSMLALRGLRATPNDIDLIVDERDAALAADTLRAAGAQSPPGPSAGFGTRVFLEYDIDGVGVDLMAGFAVRTEAGDVAYPFPESPETVAFGGQAVPLCPLEDWYVLYLLMNRPQKARLIETHFSAHPARAAAWDRWLSGNLPEAVRAQIWSQI